MSGRLSVGNEIIGYKRKTLASFEGLTRRMYHTTTVNLEYLTEQVKKEFNERKSDEEFIQKRGISILNKLKALYSKDAPNIRKGLRISSFDYRFIPEDKRKKISPTSRLIRRIFRDTKIHR